MSSPDKPLTDRQRYWLDHLRRCRASDMSIAAYAAAHDLSAFSLYEAQRRIAGKPRKPTSALATTPTSTTSTSPRFVRVSASAPTALPCRAHLRNGVVVELGVDGAALGAVLRDLAALP